jgi:hypothetical protein
MQVFKRHHNTLARVFVVGGLLAIVGLAVGGSAITRSPWWTKVGEPPTSPYRLAISTTTRSWASTAATATGR